MAEITQIPDNVKMGMALALGAVGKKSDAIIQKLDEVRHANSGAEPQTLEEILKKTAMAEFSKAIRETPALKDANATSLVEGYVGTLIDRSFERDREAKGQKKIGDSMNNYLSALGGVVEKYNIDVDGINRNEVGALMAVAPNKSAIEKALADSARVNIFGDAEKGISLDQDFVREVNKKGASDERSIAESAGTLNPTATTNPLMLLVMLFVALMSGMNPGEVLSGIMGSPNDQQKQEVYERAPEEAKKQFDAGKEQHRKDVGELISLADKLQEGKATPAELQKIKDMGIEVTEGNQKSVGQILKEYSGQLSSFSISPKEVGAKIKEKLEAAKAAALAPMQQDAPAQASTHQNAAATALGKLAEAAPTVLADALKAVVPGGGLIGAIADIAGLVPSLQTKAANTPTVAEVATPKGQGAPKGP